MVLDDSRKLPRIVLISYAMTPLTIKTYYCTVRGVTMCGVWKHIIYATDDTGV